MIQETKRILHLRLWLGDSEAQTESYSRYDEGALELATTPEAKSTSNASGSARRQAGAVHDARKHIVIDARNRMSSTGRYTDRLLEHLQNIDKSNRYTVLVQSKDTWQSVSENFRTAPADFKQFSFSPLQQIKFARMLFRLKPDLVHFTMTQQPLLYFGNIVTTTHDLTMLRFVRAGKTPGPVFWLKKLAYKFLFWLAHRKSKKIIVPTEFVANDLKDYQQFTKNKVVVTYEASEPPIKEPAEKPEGIEKPFIFHVGSPFPHKNIHRLIKAYEILLHKYPKLSLVLVGKKEFYFNELEAWAKRRDSYKSIHFPGFVSDSQLKWLYENAESYVLPSLSEGFGLPGLEAMAHACPLVSSEATCLPEVYEDGAHYFYPKDVEAIAAAIDKVLSSNELRYKLIKEGKKQINKYSWQKMAQETSSVYKQLL